MRDENKNVMIYMSQKSFTVLCRAADMRTLHILLLQNDSVPCSDADDQGAAILSLRSQVKPIPDVRSKVASDGKLGRRHPDSKT